MALPFFAKPLYAQEPSASDLESLKKETVSNPQNALAFFNLAVSYHKNKKWNAAVAAYDRVVELKSPLAPVALYYKALIYYDHWRFTPAKAILAEIQTEGLPINISQMVADLKTKISEQDYDDESNASLLIEDAPGQDKPNEKHFTGYFDASIGYNSNPYAGNSSPLPYTPMADTTEQLRAGVDFLMSYSQKTDLRLDYDFNGSFFSKQAGDNYYYHLLSLPFAYYYKKIRLKFTPNYFADNYGGDNYSIYYGAAIESTLHSGDTYWGATLSAGAIKNQTSYDAQYSGSRQRLTLYLQKRKRNSLFDFSMAFNQINYEDDAITTRSYVSYPINLAYTRNFNSLEVALTLGQETKSFPKATLMTAQRTDNRYIFDLRAGYYFTRWYQLYVDFAYLNNISTFDSAATGYYSFQQTKAVGGISANF